MTHKSWCVVKQELSGEGHTLWILIRSTLPWTWFYGEIKKILYSKICVRQPPLKLTLVVDVERCLSYKGTCHVILLAKLHDMCLYKTDNFFHINHYLKSVSKVALLHRFYCIIASMWILPLYVFMEKSEKYYVDTTSYLELWHTANLGPWTKCSRSLDPHRKERVSGKYFFFFYSPHKNVCTC